MLSGQKPYGFTITVDERGRFSGFDLYHIYFKYWYRTNSIDPILDAAAVYEHISR